MRKQVRPSESDKAALEAMSRVVKSMAGRLGYGEAEAEARVMRHIRELFAEAEKAPADTPPWPRVKVSRLPSVLPTY